MIVISVQNIFEGAERLLLPAKLKQFPKIHPVLRSFGRELSLTGVAGGCILNLYTRELVWYLLGWGILEI